MREGRDEGPEGDDLRDRMDDPGERLSREELAAVKGIAADFYTLAESGDVLPAGTARAENLVRAIARERESRRFTQALELARQCEGILPPAPLAEVRATIWQAANETQIAEMFFEGAARLRRRPISPKPQC